jgi:hypothetical protein
MVSFRTTLVISRSVQESFRHAMKHLPEIAKALIVPKKIARYAMKHLPNLDKQFCSDVAQRRGFFTRPLVPAYRVGEKFRVGRDSWPEGGHFSAGPCGHELTVCCSHISTDLIHDIRSGQSEFALVVEPPVIVLAYRFGQSSPWNDVSYCWHLQPEEWRKVPSVAESSEARTLLWITLIGSEDGIIYAQRGVTLSPAFTRSLHLAIRNQAMNAFHPEECTAALSKVFLSYPTPADRLTLAIARTQGNE